MEKLRNEILYAEVLMNNCVKTEYESNAPHPVYVQRARKYQELLNKWKKLHGDIPYKDKTYYVVHHVDEMGWSAGYTILDNKDKANKLADENNARLYWRAEGFAYVQTW